MRAFAETEDTARYKVMNVGNVHSEATGFVLSQQIGTLKFSRRVRCDQPFEVYWHFGGTLQLKKNLKYNRLELAIRN